MKAYKNILIFGGGYQGKKYISHFSSRKIPFCVVTKSKALNIQDKHLFFYEVENKESSFFDSFDLIILAVSPIKEQEKILQYLLKLSLLQDILIEKPVSYDSELFKYLVGKQNIYFFIDDIVFSKIFTKVFSSEDVFILSLPKREVEERKNIIEHAFGGFLLHKNFDTLLKNIIIKEDISSGDTELLIYQFTTFKKQLSCLGGKLFLLSRQIDSLDFSRSLSFILSLGEEEKNTYKNNFFLLHLFLK